MVLTLNENKNLVVSRSTNICWKDSITARGVWCFYLGCKSGYE